MRRARPSLVMAALLTRTSMRPNSFEAFANASLMDSADDMSMGIGHASPPLLRISDASSSNLSIARAATTTRCPAAESASAHARPMPRLAPVTNAVRFDMKLHDIRGGLVEGRNLLNDLD